MTRIKPHLRLRVDGRIEVVRPGVHGMSEAQLRAFIVARSGTLEAYCRRLRLSYGQVGVALRTRCGSAYYGAGSTTYMRLLFGLPVRPEPRLLDMAAKRGYTRVRDLLSTTDGART